MPDSISIYEQKTSPESLSVSINQTGVNPHTESGNIVQRMGPTSSSFITTFRISRVAPDESAETNSPPKKRNSRSVATRNL